MTKEQLVAYIDEVIQQGERLRQQGAAAPRGELASRWYPRVMSVFHLLGSRADPWKFAVAKCPSERTDASTEKLLGVLAAIREAIDLGMLDDIEETAHADAFAAMLEQARELARDGVVAAAGSVAQTVLAEQLRESALRTRCLPEGGASPSEIITALYLRGQLSKPATEAARRLTAIGEHCQHDRQPPLEPAEVLTMIDGVAELLSTPT